MKTAVLSAVFCLLAGAGVAANGVFYLCNMQSKHRQVNWVADTVGFVVFEDGNVTVVDDWVMHFMGRPQDARVRKSGANTLRIKWTLTGIKGRSGARMPPANYHATLNTKTKAVTIRVSSSAFADARIAENGSCQIQNSLPKVFGNSS